MAEFVSDVLKVVPRHMQIEFPKAPLKMNIVREGALTICTIDAEKLMEAFDRQYEPLIRAQKKIDDQQYGGGWAKWFSSRTVFQGTAKQHKEDPNDIPLRGRRIAIAKAKRNMWNFILNNLDYIVKAVGGSVCKATDEMDRYLTKWAYENRQAQDLSMKTNARKIILSKGIQPLDMDRVTFYVNTGTSFTTSQVGVLGLPLIERGFSVTIITRRDNVILAKDRPYTFKNGTKIIIDKDTSLFEIYSDLLSRGLII